MDAAILGLVGVVVGSATSFAATWTSTRSGTIRAREERLGTHVQRVREQLGGAYLDATEALQWISNHNVEDSMSPHFIDSYQPRTEVAIDRLRESRRSFGLLASMGVKAELSELCMQVAITLNVADDAWHQTQEYTVKIRNKESKMYPTMRKLFDENYSRLLESREALTGLDGSDSSAKEVDRGLILPGSLLHRVREVVGAPDAVLIARSPRKSPRFRRLSGK